MCLNATPKVATVFNHEARVAHAVAKSIFETGNRDALNDLILQRFYFYEAIKSLDYTFADLHFKAYDVCTEQDLASVSIRMTLSPDFYMSADANGNPPSWHEKPIENWESETRVLAVSMYTESTFVRRVSSFLYDNNFPIFVEQSITELTTPSYVQTNSDRFLLAGNRALDDAHIFMDYLKNSTVRHVSIVYLNSARSTMDEAYYKSFMQVFTGNVNTCIKDL